MAGPFSTDFAASFGNGAFLASGRAAARGTGVPQFSVGQPATQVRASSFASPRGRATVATYVVSVAARGIAAARAAAGGASQFPLGLRGATQSRGTIIDQVTAQVSARGTARPRGFVQRVTPVVARGTARPSSVAGAATFSGASPFTAQFSVDFGAGAGVPVTMSARGIAAPRGTASRAFGLFAVRGFAMPRGRTTAVARAPALAARGRAIAFGTSQDSIQAQQVIIAGAPPPLTIWQRLAVVTPSHEMHEKPRVLRQTFGDGYGQTVPDGLTPIERTLTLTWENIDRIEADNIIKFLQDNIGTPISFVAPREDYPRKWLAKDWRRTSPQPNSDNITVTLEDRNPAVGVKIGSNAAVWDEFLWNSGAHWG